ncbi:hypothetical protein H5395_17030 [Paracoccus sp. MC1854]|uniref:hypothetical protein n=1 Tax=Paracoccus sp. MC1854 TaxID=2760306 RepID=UPI001603FE16|nr:hypothetical protein [Paracoccus sp. MC1854]MBB1493169.1 hypothetical protein [Paracoccus sp. MC1854]
MVKVFWLLVVINGQDYVVEYNLGANDCADLIADRMPQLPEAEAWICEVQP